MTAWSFPHIDSLSGQRLLGGLELGLCLLQLFGHLLQVLIKRGDDALVLLALVGEILDPLRVCLLRLVDLLEDARLEVMVSVIQRARKIVEAGRATGAVEAGDVGV